MSNDTEVSHASAMRTGRFMIIDDEPCKIVDIKTSAPGKHGHAKVRITAISLFSGSKKGYMGSSHDKVMVPIIDKRSAQVLALSENKASIMDTNSYETFDVDVPESMEGELSEGEQIQYWVVLGKKLLQN